MFITKVFNQWKAFFWVIIIACFAQFFFMAKGIENIPFFLYHMYGYAHQPMDSLKVILVKTPDGYLNPFELSGRESEMLMNNVMYYDQMKKQNWKDDLIPTIYNRFSKRLPISTYNYLQKGLVNDSIALSKYTDWWQQYFNKVHCNSYDSVSVVLGYVYYYPGHIKSPIDSIIFTSHLK